MLSDNSHELFPLNRLIGSAKSLLLELPIFNQKHSLEDPIDVAQALDNSMRFEGV